MIKIAKCPRSGFMGYEFEVNCKCYCHEPGYVSRDFTFVPCCNCSFNGSGNPPDKHKEYLIISNHPENLEISEGRRSRIPLINQHVIEKYPELLEFIKINNHEIELREQNND